jgi:hypothetical protein
VCRNSVAAYSVYSGSLNPRIFGSSPLEAKLKINVLVKLQTISMFTVYFFCLASQEVLTCTE